MSALLTRERSRAADYLDDFAGQLREGGLDVSPSAIRDDGQIHRCDLIDGGSSGRGDGSYCVYSDRRPGGWFQNWQDGLGVRALRLAAAPPLSDAERSAFRAQMERQRAQRESEEAQRREERRASVASMWQSAVPLVAHQYGDTKGVGLAGQRLRMYAGPLVLSGVQCDGAIVVPLYDHDRRLPSALQFINAAGEKRFLGPVGGCYFPIGAEPADTLVIAEGLATALSVHEATGLPIATAMTCGNLARIGKLMRERQGPNAKIIFAADDDTKGAA